MNYNCVTEIDRKAVKNEILLEFLCADLEEKLEARKYFSPSAPLLGNRLISPVGN